jgi:hypothetical protein
MGSIMLVRGPRVVTRAATAGYIAGRHRRPPATAPVVGGTLQDNLAELIDEYTDTEGGFTAEELAAARAALYGAEGSDSGHAA